MDLKGMMGQLQGMQQKMQDMQESLANTEIEGSAGGGLVKVTMDGKGVLKGVSIDPSLLKPEDAEIIEDLIVAASDDGRSKTETIMQDKMKEVTGGLPLPPGMNPFG